MIMNIMKDYCFEVELNLGYNCMGCCMDEVLYPVVKFSDEEAAAIRDWAADAGEISLDELEDALPDLQERIAKAVYDSIWWWCVEDGIANNGYEDSGLEMFESEVADGTYVIPDYDPDAELTDREDFDDLYEAWELSKEGLEGQEKIDYLEARYQITDSTDFSAIDYNVVFPEELLD